jgi:hypothetical protein
LVKSEKVADDTIYTVKNLFGQAESNLSVFCRSLAEQLREKHLLNKPILISIGLKKEQIERFDILKFLEAEIIKSYKQ